MRRKYLDHISWICDYKPGGETVTAISIESIAEGNKYWQSTKEGSVEKSCAHLECLVKRR